MSASDYALKYDHDGRPIRTPSIDDDVLLSFRRERVNPATALYVTQDDTLLLFLYSPIVSRTVNLSLRYQGPNGEIRPEFYTLTGLTVGTTPKTLVIPGSEGFLLSASVETPGAPRGQAFVALQLVRGRGTGDATIGHVLLAGYPGVTTSICFPQSPIQSSLDGRGFTTSFTIGAPPAGADWFTTVPAGELWILRGAFALLTASVAVANRVPALIIADGSGNFLVDSVAPAAIVASTAVRVSWAGGLAAVSNLLTQSVPMALEVRMPAGFTVQSATVNIQAADQWSSVALLIERFVTG